MAGNYPNGGYRTSAAKELSTLSHGTSQTVTSGRPGIGEVLPPPKVDHGPPGRLGGTRGGGIESWGKPAGGSTTIIDLRPYQDSTGGIGDRLNWRQRDQLFRRHTIDLGSSEYRDISPGKLRRAAVRLARRIVGVGKRLPRHVFKDLVLMILDQILANLEERTVRSVEEAVIPANWFLLGYCAEAGGGPGVIPSGAVTANPPPNVNGTIVQSQITWDGCLGGQAIVPSAIIRKYVGFWRQTSTLGPRYEHIVSYRTHHPVNEAPWEVTYRRAKFGFNPSPFGQPYGREGGDHPPGENPTPPKPLRARKDEKFRAPPWLTVPLNAAYFATEANDFIDIAYDNLGRKCGARTPQAKLLCVINNFDSMDMPRFLTDLAINQISDYVIGSFHGKVGAARRDLGVSGVTFTVGRDPSGPASLTFETPQ